MKQIIKADALLSKQYSQKASFGNIGDVKYTVSTVVPNGGAWCDGAEYTQAQFPDVYQMLVDGKLSSTDYSIFNNSVSTNGYCALFALDSSAQKFKVPKLLDKYVMDLADDVPVVGNGMALGLTNGTSLEGLGFSSDGIVTHRTGNYGANVGTANSGSGSTSGAAGVTTDPEKSGLIADTSNLGKTVTLKAYVVLYSSAAGASEVQAAEFIQGLSGKADTDLNNVSALGKETVVGWGMPDYTATISLNVSQLTSGYTAPTDGCIIGYWNPKNTTGPQKITLNGITIWGGDTYVTGVFIYMKKDDVVVFGQTDKTSTDIKFAPLKGVN